MTTQTRLQENKRYVEKRQMEKRANKTANFVKWGRGKREAMANNVNCKDMRFVIRILIDVDDVYPATAPEIGKLTGDYFRTSSPATAPEIPLTWLETTSVFPQRGSDDATQLR